MTIDPHVMFNRAAAHTFCRAKLLLSSLFLVMCGVLLILCRGIAASSGEWIGLSLTFMPVFLSAGAMLSLGILLTRVYHDEVKGREVSYWKVVAKTWQTALGASYFCVPIILSYLLMWVLLGFFFLFREIPGFGEVIGVLLAFAPFLINLGSLLLCLFTIAILYLVTPVVALKSVDPVTVWQGSVMRVKEKALSTLQQGVIALTPCALTVALLSLAASLTGNIIYSTQPTPLAEAMSWVVIMVPYALLLSPTVVFFFNYAAEAHVACRRLEHVEQS